MNVIKSRRLYFVEQCCAENGVPHNCLGLCVEDNDATRSLPFSSFCDKYEDIIDSCAVLPTCKFHIHQHKS